MEAHGPRRKLTTILCADCAGYSRMMHADEEGTYRTLHMCRELIARLIDEHEGRVFGSAGDGLVAEFPSPVEAVRAALEIQQAIEGVVSKLAESHRMRFRIGINLGDVLIENDDLFGDGVNVAARLEGLAEPGGVCVSDSVHEQVKNKLPNDWDDLGNVPVKNIAEPVHVFRAHMRAEAARQPKPARTGPARRFRVAGVGVLVLLALGSLAVYRLWQKSPPLCGRASIAVLPFANLSGDTADEYFGDGTAEDIIAALGRFSDLSVIAYVAVQPYKGKTDRLEEIRRDLGVCYILTGSVRRSGDHALVATQLIDAQSGRLLGADSYDGELKDPFALRNQLTLWVVGKLAIKVQDLERQRALKKPTDSLDAYDLALRGRDAYARRTRTANTEARRYFERAIELDPTFASAYAALGWTYLAAATSGWTEFRDDAIRQAESLAEKAIELDKDNAEAHRALATAHFAEGKYELAMSEDDRAIALNPSDADGYAGRGSDLVYAGNSKAAIESFEIAMRLNPTMGSGREEPVGWAYYLDRRYDDAVRALEAGVHKSPSDYYIYAGLAASYAQLGRGEDAARAAAEVLKTWPFFRIDSFTADFQSLSDRALISEGLHAAGLQ